MFLAVIIAWKGRKATNWLHYINNVFLFSKIANIALFLRADALVGIIYLLIVVGESLFFHTEVWENSGFTFFSGYRDRT